MRMSRFLSLFAAPLLVTAACALPSGDGEAPRVQEGTIGPRSPAAAAAGAYEAAKTMYDIAKTIDSFGEPDPNTTILAKLDQMAVELEKIRTAMNDVRAAVDRIEDHLVRQTNLAAVNDALDALEYARRANLATRYLLQDPTNVALRYDADSESLTGMNRFVERESMFKTTGPDLSQERFDHRFAYPASVAALTARLVFLRTQNSPTAFRSALAAEMQRYEGFYAGLRTKLNASLQCTATQSSYGGIDNPVQCDIFVSCKDDVVLAPGEANPDPGTHQNVVCFGAFDPQFYEEGPEEALRAEHGSLEMDALVLMLRNLRQTGFASGSAPGGILGEGAMPLFVANAPTVLDATAGAQNLTLAVASEWSMSPSQLWVHNANGTLRNADSGRCLDVYAWSTADGADVGMWDCLGGDNQRWVRDGSALRNVYTNKCLENVPFQVKSTRWGFVVTRAKVTQKTCNGSAAQRWSSSDPTAAVPH
ncbi:MAG: RICIN domain-containing protein [Polyangiaceae bacterium]|nr:RICIN domain-containing protein [Polyangiaceae bacterium]